MKAANLTTLDGLFKEVYGPNVIELLPKAARLIKDFPYVQRDARVSQLKIEIQEADILSLGVERGRVDGERGCSSSSSAAKEDVDVTALDLGRP